MRRGTERERTNVYRSPALNERYEKKLYILTCVCVYVCAHTDVCMRVCVRSICSVDIQIGSAAIRSGF